MILLIDFLLFSIDQRYTVTWQGGCRTIASPIGRISQQWVAPGCIACSALTIAYGRKIHSWPHTVKLEQPWIEADAI